jgi:hypothetical protein
MNTKKYLLSLGTAIATSKLVKAISRIDGDDVFSTVGLERRRTHVWEHVAFFGIGAVAGAGVALLLAPASGKETRERINGEVDRLTNMANEKIREVKEQAPSLIARNSESENQYSNHHR